MPGKAPGAPLYVLALRPAAREVVVGSRESLERTTLVASGVNWIVEEPSRPVRATVQIRHRHRAALATVHPTAEGGARIEFDEPQMAVTPGQAAVFYQGDAVLGGGWISFAHPFP
jgi:tRNA-specific 2-thiouridylase